MAAIDACWLHGLYVVPEEWGSGVAVALHDAALAAMPDCAELQLWMLEENHRARRFYEQRGWRLKRRTIAVVASDVGSAVRHGRRRLATRASSR